MAQSGTGIKIDNGKVSTHSGLKRLIEEHKAVRQTKKELKEKKKAGEEVYQAFTQTDSLLLDSANVAGILQDSLENRAPLVNLPTDSSQLVQLGRQQLDKELGDYDSYSKVKELAGMGNPLDSAGQERWKDQALKEGNELLNDQLGDNQAYQEARKLSGQYESYISKDTVMVDQVAETAASQFIRADGLQELDSDVPMADQYNQLTEASTALAEASRDPEQARRYALQQSSRLMAADLGQLSPKLEKAQQQFAKHKKRLAWFKSAESLKSTPLHQRVIWGGNFNISRFDPVTVDLAPYLGFRIVPKISVGVSLDYQLLADYQDKHLTTTPQYRAWRYYLDYDLVKGFFAHGEYERRRAFSQAENENINPIEESAYLGIGRAFNLPKGFRMTSTFLVDLLDPGLQHFSKEAFQFRVGIGR